MPEGTKPKGPYEEFAAALEAIPPGTLPEQKAELQLAAYQRMYDRVQAGEALEPHAAKAAKKISAKLLPPPLQADVTPTDITPGADGLAR